MKEIIAIDGHAATGKSTQANKIARFLNYIYIDSGSMYRAVTLYFLKNNMLKESFDSNIIIDNLKFVNLELKFIKDSYFIFLNGDNIENDIRNMDVSENVSQIAAIPEVRSFLVKIQRKIASNNNVVMDGRDIGTVVFPKAKKKFFLVASDKIRAKRRYDELKIDNNNIKFSKVLENLISRDLEDSTRKTSPLKPAKDAVIIDTSNLTEKQVFEKLISLIREWNNWNNN